MDSLLSQSYCSASTHISVVFRCDRPPSTRIKALKEGLGYGIRLVALFNAVYLVMTPDSRRCIYTPQWAGGAPIVSVHLSECDECDLSNQAASSILVAENPRPSALRERARSRSDITLICINSPPRLPTGLFTRLPRSFSNADALPADLSMGHN